MAFCNAMIRTSPKNYRKNSLLKSSLNYSSPAKATSVYHFQFSTCTIGMAVVVVVIGVVAVFIAVAVRLEWLGCCKCNLSARYLLFETDCKFQISEQVEIKFLLGNSGKFRCIQNSYNRGIY